MIRNALLLLFMLRTISTNSINSFPKRISTEKPDILLEDPLISKSADSPTHISEFTDPDTGLNPFLDLEEGPTFIGRNVMEDETRDDQPFMDFDMVEGDAPARRWMDLDFPKEPIEESLPRWRPFEDDIKEDKSETTIQPLMTEIDDTTTNIPPYATASVEDKLCDKEISDNAEQKVKTEIATSEFSNTTVIYASVSIVIIITAFILILGSCMWSRRKLSRTLRAPTSNNSELKC